jgi:hypothetical protein
MHLKIERFARAVQQTSATATEAEEWWALGSRALYFVHLLWHWCAVVHDEYKNTYIYLSIHTYIYIHIRIHINMYIYMRVFYSIESGYIRFQFLARRVPRQSVFRYWGHQKSNIQKIEDIFESFNRQKSDQKKKKKGKKIRQIYMYIWLFQ